MYVPLTFGVPNFIYAIFHSKVKLYLPPTIDGFTLDRNTYRYASIASSAVSPSILAVTLNQLCVGEFEECLYYKIYIEIYFNAY